MNEMERMEEYDYRDSRGGNYRDDYRRDYRYDYRDEYGRNQRDNYGRNRRNYRNYRNYRDEYTTMLEEVCEDGMELARAYEDVSEIAQGQDRQKLMKLADKQKEIYRWTKDIMESKM